MPAFLKLTSLSITAFQVACHPSSHGTASTFSGFYRNTGICNMPKGGHTKTYTYSSQNRRPEHFLRSTKMVLPSTWATLAKKKRGTLKQNKTKQNKEEEEEEEEEEDYRREGGSACTKPFLKR